MSMRTLLRFEFALWIAVGLLLVGSYISHKVAIDHIREFALAEYLSHDVDPRKENIERSFRLSYQTLRTIGLLPSISNHKFGQQIDSITLGAGQQLYSNLAHEFPVSEIYVIPKGFNPAVDHPLVTYDSLVLNINDEIAGEDEVRKTDIPEEHEDEEYYAYARILDEFYQQHQALDSQNINLISAQSTPEIRTCDNTQYTSIAHGDVLESHGFGYAVPSYNNKGELSGMVAAILRLNVFEALLRMEPMLVLTPKDRLHANKIGFKPSAKSSDLALIQPETKLFITDRSSPFKDSLKYVAQNLKNSLDSSKYTLIPLDIKDKSPWYLLVRHPEDLNQGQQNLVHIIFSLWAILVCFLGFYGSIWLSKTKAKQESMDHANQRLLAFFEKMPVSVIVTDAQEKITYVNSAFEEHSGYSAQDILGRTPKILSTKANLEAHKDIKAHIYSGKNWKGVLCNRRKDGSLYWIQSTISPYFEQGQITHFIAVHEDINELHNKELELEQAKQDAQMATLAKSEFLSVMSHEIRTPLHAVLSYSQILSVEEHLPSQREALDILERSAKHLLGLINDILDFSKMEAGKMELHQESFAIEELLHDCHRLFAQYAEEKGVDLQLFWEQQIQSHVLADRVRLGQVLSNLCSNAIKFAPQGKVSLRAKILEETPSHLRILIEVHDNGIGMSAEQIERLFQPFSQADKSIASKFGGTGLGLAISHRILELHGSKLKVQSKIGEGSNFQFELTLQKSSQTSPKAKLSVSSHPLAGKKILVVDDNAINLKIANKFLSMWEVQCTTASSGKDALSLIQDHSFDLILMDLQMPEMSGYETSLKILSINNEIPILALSADHGSEMETKVLKHGMKGWVSKPFKSEDLHQKILQQLHN